MNNRFKIPDSGYSQDDLIDRLSAAKENDVDWRNARSWSLVYYAGEDHTDFLKQVYSLYFSENAAGPSLFPSLQRLEAEVVSMVLDLLGSRGDEVGTMTSGGTESILLAIKAYRDQARILQPEITKPEILIPESAHPAFLKACHYFGLNAIAIPLNTEFEVDLDALRERITHNTICIVASAPSFPHGVMDPVQAIGKIALDNKTGLHVDACLGGFLLPFMPQLGYNIPEFDFRVPGVTSISADLHKNGYTAKGASAVLYRTASLRRYQYYVNTEWPGGLYASPGMMGTRPGGVIAAAWAAMMVLGKDGYLQMTAKAMETTHRLMAGISCYPALNIIGNPIMNVFAFSTDEFDIFTLGDRLDSKGWRINRQNNPRSLHVVVTPNHEKVVEQFLHDLKMALTEEKLQPSAPSGNSQAILYGGTTDTDTHDEPMEAALSRLDKLYSL